MEDMTQTLKVQLAYILSASHSGSTLLAMLLNSHPDVCSVGELKATSLGDPDKYLCSCGTRIKECSFWNNISSCMSENGINFNIWNSCTDLKHNATGYIECLLKPLHRGPLLEYVRDVALYMSPTWKKQLQQFQNVNYALMRCILKQTGKKILVDSSKIGIRLKYLLKNPLLDVKIIRLIRDGRGVALSYTDPAKYADSKDVNLRGGGMNSFKEKPRTIDRAAYEWRRSNEEAEEIIKRVDTKQWVEIRYEDLCQDKSAALQRIFEFLKVSKECNEIGFSSMQHHILGNGMRLDFTNEVCLDERWKEDLKLSDLKIFEAIAGKMNKSYGYR